MQAQWKVESGDRSRIGVRVAVRDEDRPDLPMGAPHVRGPRPTLALSLVVTLSLTPVQRFRMHSIPSCLQVTTNHLALALALVLTVTLTLT